MKKISSSIIVFSLFVLLFSSCTSVETLVIDVEKPALLTLPPAARNITIVNNAVIQPYNTGHDQTIMGRASNTPIEVNNDSVDYIFMRTVGEELDSKSYFDNINVYAYPTRLDDDYNQIIPLEKENILHIADETNADVVLSIDKIFISTSLHTIPADDYIAEIYNILDLKADILYNIYNKEGKQIAPTITDADSIFWVEARIQQKLISDSIPSRENAMKVGAVVLASKVASALAPYKESQNRIFYSDVKDAKKMAEQNDWTKAQAIWMTSFEREKNSKPKARIANNIALSYELSDNLVEALRWNQTSIDLFKEEQKTSVDKQYLESAEIYKQILLDRVNDFRVLDLKEDK